MAAMVPFALLRGSGIKSPYLPPAAEPTGVHPSITASA